MSDPSPIFLYAFGSLSLWILRISFLKVLQPFKKSDFPAIPGNVLQNLQVIRPFSYTSQVKWESHESWNCLLTFFYPLQRSLLVSLLQLQALLAGLACSISTSLMDDDFDCLLASVTESLLSPFLFTKFDNFNCWDVFTCLRMHTAHW
jgi:hypothetical protein